MTLDTSRPGAGKPSGLMFAVLVLGGLLVVLDVTITNIASGPWPRISTPPCR